MLAFRNSHTIAAAHPSSSSATPVVCTRLDIMSNVFDKMVADYKKVKIQFGVTLMIIFNCIPWLQIA